MYKVKLFYLYSEDIGLFKEFPDIVMSDVIYDEESGLYLYLYAFTEWRKLYKRFKKERNMNIFKVKTVYMNPPQFDEFCKKNNYHYLDVFNINEKVFIDGKEEMKFASVLATVGEIDQIYYYREDLLDSTLSIDAIDMIISYYSNNLFNDKLCKILDKVYNIDIVTDILYPIDDIDYSNLTIDELGLFIRTYCKLFK